MKSIDWERIKGLRGLLHTKRLEPTQQAARVVAMQRNIVLPSRAGVICAVLYYLFYSGWKYEGGATRLVAQDLLKSYFLAYLACNVIAAFTLFSWRRIPAELFQWLAFTLGLLDGIFMAGLAMATGGFQSIIFWVFPGLIVLNAISIPLATPQLVLNLMLSLFYLAAGIANSNIEKNEREEFPLIGTPGRGAAAARGTNQSSRSNDLMTPFDAPEATTRTGRGLWGRIAASSLPDEEEITTEPLLLKFSVLWLFAFCCYGVQVLAERQRRSEEEAHEMGLRQGQLRSAGRMAAEFAHQIKNPLAIINNAAYSLQRALNEQRGDPLRQLQIIQEEIERSDKIITRIMGYAQLNEGSVEKLNFPEELEHAVRQVFPPASDYPIKIERRCGRDLPPLLMQRNHLDEILVNLLQNAREALGEKGGRIFVGARRLSENLLEISIADSGPGIPDDKLERVFEAHYTTKEKGTGLGLAIVKHNAELYAGTVRAESKLGKGARFVLVFPAKTVIKPEGKI